MIINEQTNRLYLSENLMLWYPEFFGELKRVLEKHDVDYWLLKGTADIWCRDYMPVQVSEGEFLWFRFRPGYYGKKLEYKITQQSALQAQDLFPGEQRCSDLVLDGGNLVYGKQVAVTTEKFYQYNLASGKSPEVLLRQLQEELDIERIFVLPRQPFDPTGHADGMVRLLDDSRLLVADYAYEQPWWRSKMDRALRQTGLELIHFPCEPTEDRNSYGDYTARGIYINFLHIGNLIILPQFDLKTDAEAVNVTHQIYPDHVIETLNCNEIVKEGGVLNCLSWNNLKMR